MSTRTVTIFLAFLIMLYPCNSLIRNLSAEDIQAQRVTSCEERNIASVEKIADEILFDSIGESPFKHPTFPLFSFAIDVDRERIRVRGSSGNVNNWISMKEGGESCYKWGLIGAWTICIAFKGDRLGIYDNGDWQYLSVFSGGSARSGKLNLEVTTNGSEGFLSINRGRPVRLWKRDTVEDVVLTSKGNCQSSCKTKNEWVCSKEGVNCTQTMRDFSAVTSGNVGSCFTTYSAQSRKAYDICDKNGIITSKNLATGEEKRIGEGFLFRKKEIVCD